MKTNKITLKQKRFAEEYLIDLNGTQAAIRAGYSEKTAYSQAERLLRNVEVQAAIQQAMEKRSARMEITQDMVLQELAKLGFSNMMDFVSLDKKSDPFVDLSAMTREQAAAVTEITIEEYCEGGGEDAREVKRVKVKLADKRSALVDIGKHLGMFKDKVEVTGKDGGPIRTKNVTANINLDKLAGMSAQELAKLYFDKK